MTDAGAAGLALLAAGIRITDREIVWFGDRLLRFRESDADVEERLTRTLVGVLYSCYYTVSRPMLQGEIEIVRKSGPEGSIAARLASANPGAGRLESQWQCRAVRTGPDRIVVHKDGLTLSVPKDRVVPADDPPGTVQSGAVVHVRTPAGSLNRSAGFYVAHSDREMDYGRPLTRLYLNVSPDYAPSLLADLCAALNREGFAFDFKVAKDLNTFYRSDVAVLYSPRDDYADVARLVRARLDRHRPGLRSTVPALVRRLEPGVGASDDPANGLSFGFDRCTVIAGGLVRSRHETDPAARVRSIDAAFHERGLDPARPYLAPGAEDIYAGRP